MDEMLEDAKIYLRMVWRHRWMALICAFVVCLIGWVGVAIVPNKYQSIAVLYVEKTSLLQPLLKDLALQSAAADEMAIMIRHALFVRPNLEKLAAVAGIDKTKVSLSKFDSVINKIEASFEINSPADQQGVYNIAYQHADPRVARSIVRTTVQMFMETLTNARKNDSETAQRFIRKQLKENETKLQEAEQRLKEFKQKNIGLMPDNGRSYYGRLEEGMNLYRNAVLELNEAEVSAGSIRAQLNSFKALEAGGVQNPVFEQVKAQQTKLTELQLKFTDKHPDVIAAKKLLDELVAKTSSKARNIASTGERNLNSLDYNPAYQGLKLQLSKAEANAAALRARVAEHKRRRDALEQNIVAIPKVEAELANLNRDYTVQRDKYQTLAEGLEIATLSDKAANGKVKVLEWPRLPATPIGPRRLVFNAAVFAIAVASGVALALVLALSNPVIYTRRGLEKLIDLPVLGTVSYNAGTGDLKSYKPFVDVSFFFGIGVLLVLYVTLNGMYLLKVDMLINLAGYGFGG
ncbi:MAG: XrtA system polysaccharide chain length determinant [Gammaproteobacteria bacterium]